MCCLLLFAQLLKSADDLISLHYSKSFPNYSGIQELHQLSKFTQNNSCIIPASIAVNAM